MKINRDNRHFKIWLSARDMYNWAHRPGARWLGSFLSDRRVFAEFDDGGDLIDLQIDGGHGDQDCPTDEFNACIDDHRTDD